MRALANLCHSIVPCSHDDRLATHCIVFPQGLVVGWNRSLKQTHGQKSFPPPPGRRIATQPHAHLNRLRPPPHYCQADGVRWQIGLRYSDFVEFDRELRANFSADELCGLGTLPDRTFLRNSGNPTLIESRKVKRQSQFVTYHFPMRCFVRRDPSGC